MSGEPAVSRWAGLFCPVFLGAVLGAVLLIRGCG